MFLNNKYSRWYHNIINTACQAQRQKYNESYFEEHHIIPKCMNGTNKKENLVLLTAREHFICHILLYKMVEEKSIIYFKLLNAILYFKGENNKKNQKRYINSRLYEHIKRKASQYKKDNYNRELDIKRRKKISETMKIKWQNPEYIKSQKPIIRSQEYKEKMSLAMKKSHKEKPRFSKNLKTKTYSKCLIRKNEITKETTINQIPQYMKYGWIRVVRDPGTAPGLKQPSAANGI